MPPRAARTHPYINFPANSDYQTNLNRLKRKNVSEGKRICWFALERVELADQMRELLQVNPYGRVFDRNEPIYKELVLEFFSTFTLSETEISFRIGGIFRTLTKREFGIACGIWGPDEDEEYDGAIKEFSENTAEHWRAVTLTPEVPYDSQNTKATGMPHILKYLHMILAHTITARGDSNGNVTAVDVFILSHLFTHIPIDLGSIVARQAKEFSSNNRKSTLGLGSIITRIARYFNVPEDTQPELTVITALPPAITIDTMRNMHMVRKQGERYVLQPQRRIQAPVPPPMEVPPPAPEPAQRSIEDRLEELRQMLVQTQASVEQIRQYLINYGINPEYADILRTPHQPPNP